MKKINKLIIYDKCYSEDGIQEYIAKSSNLDNECSYNSSIGRERLATIKEIIFTIDYLRLQNSGRSFKPDVELIKICEEFIEDFENL